MDMGMDIYWRELRETRNRNKAQQAKEIFLSKVEALAQEINEIFKESQGEIASFTRGLVKLIVGEDLKKINPKLVSKAMEIFEERNKGIKREFHHEDKKGMMLYFMENGDGVDKCIFKEIFRLARESCRIEFENIRGKILKIFLYKYEKDGNYKEITLGMNNKGNSVKKVSTKNLSFLLSSQPPNS